MHRSRGISYLILSSLCFAAACSAPGEEGSDSVRSSGSAIIGGAETSGYPAIGMLFNPQGKYNVCTGFLIASNLVATAAHCFTPESPPLWFSTSDGAPVSQPTQVDTIPGLVKHPVELFVRHPDAKLPNTGSAAYPWHFDFAVAKLKTPLAVTPIPYGNTITKGTACTMVGYGLTAVSGGTGGRKKEGTATAVNVVQQDGHSVLTLGQPSATAYLGDSGGPFLCDGVAVGVFSYMAASSPRSARYYGGTDGNVKTWLDSMIAMYAPPPVPDGGADASATDGGDEPDPNADAGVPRTPPDSGDWAEPSGPEAESGCAMHASSSSTTSEAILIVVVLGLLLSRRRRALGP